MLKKFIAFQAEHPDILNVTTQVLSAETNPANRAYTPTPSAVLMQSNERYVIWRDGDEIIKIKYDDTGRITKQAHLKYEPNFGTLFSLIQLINGMVKDNQYPHMTEKIVLHIIQKLILIINQLHRHKWYHNDIKPTNILVCPVSVQSWETFKTLESQLNQRHRFAASNYLQSVKSQARRTTIECAEKKNEFNNFKHDMIVVLFDSHHAINTNPGSTQQTNHSLSLLGKLCSILTCTTPPKTARMLFIALLLNNTFTLKLCDLEWITQDTHYSHNTGTHGYLCYSPTPLPDNKHKDRYALAITLISILLPDEYRAYQQRVRTDHSPESGHIASNVLLKQAREVTLSPLRQFYLTQALNMIGHADQIPEIPNQATSVSQMIKRYVCCFFQSPNPSENTQPLLEGDSETAQQQVNKYKKNRTLDKISAR